MSTIRSNVPGRGEGPAEGRGDKKMIHPVDDESKKHDGKDDKHKVCGRVGCGKSESLMKCSACKSTWYCSLQCQKMHWKKYRKECKRIAQGRQEAAAIFPTAATRLAMRVIDDKDLFSPPPPQPDCPVCFLPLPLNHQEQMRMTCCGNMVCCGCVHEMNRVIDVENYKKIMEIPEDPTLLKTRCPFCRKLLASTQQKCLEQIRILMDKNDAIAIRCMALDHMPGSPTIFESPQDAGKAFALYMQAADLGDAEACFAFAIIYGDGMYVKKGHDMEMHCLKLAAMGGHLDARHNLGYTEATVRNLTLGIMHFLIAAVAGQKLSMGNVTHAYRLGMVTKEEYERVLRAHQKVLDDETSKPRENYKRHAIRQSKKNGDNMP